MFHRAGRRIGWSLAAMMIGSPAVSAMSQPVRPTGLSARCTMRVVCLAPHDWCPGPLSLIEESPSAVGSLGTSQAALPPTLPSSPSIEPVPPVVVSTLPELDLVNAPEKAEPAGRSTRSMREEFDAAVAMIGQLTESIRTIESRWFNLPPGDEAAVTLHRARRMASAIHWMAWMMLPLNSSDQGMAGDDRNAWASSIPPQCIIDGWVQQWRAQNVRLKSVASWADAYRIGLFAGQLANRWDQATRRQQERSIDQIVAFMKEPPQSIDMLQWERATQSLVRFGAIWLDGTAAQIEQSAWQMRRWSSELHRIAGRSKPTIY
jgi:hypothetical protein